VPDETHLDTYCAEERIMPGYILMHADVTDPEGYEHFKVAAAKAIEDHGGRYLVLRTEPGSGLTALGRHAS
jgi:hypothetical protein